MSRRVRTGTGFLDAQGARRFVEHYLFGVLPANEVFNMLDGERSQSGRRLGVPLANIARLQEAMWYLYYRTDTTLSVIGEGTNRSHHVALKGARKVEELREVAPQTLDEARLVSAWDRMKAEGLVKRFHS